MNKVSLITIHNEFNFGSVLQTIATTSLIKKMGCKVVVVNYIRNRSTWKYLFLKSALSLKKIIELVVRIPIIAINKRKFSEYLLRYVDVSSPIYASDDFSKLCPVADIYLTGSDQVWNSVHNEGIDKRFYFDDLPEKATRVAYASSIGREALDPKEYIEVRRMLGKYKAISVREESAKKIIESMGFKVMHVLDPTFMLTREDWKVYMSDRIVKEPYLLVYIPYNVHDKKVIYKTVRRISERNRLKIVAFAWHQLLPELMADKTIYFPNPGDFLSLMYYADFVVTNSFHGTAFSINLNKNFFVYLPTSFGTRIISILELCKLESRLLEENEIASDNKIDIVIDYNYVNNILNEERANSYEFLTKALKM